MSPQFFKKKRDCKLRWDEDSKRLQSFLASVAHFVHPVPSCFISALVQYLQTGEELEWSVQSSAL